METSRHGSILILHVGARAVNLLSRQEILRILKILGVSLLAGLLANGLILTSWWTISPRAGQPGVQNSNSCFYESTQWNCIQKKLDTHLLDPGAVAWVETPSNYFFHDHSLGTKWNPFIGSGYPEFLNGHNKPISPSRIVLSFFPGDDGRDFVVFFRFLIWSFGFALMVSLLGGGAFLQFFAALFSHLIPYPAMYLDHVFLDVDMLAPWLVIWFFLGFDEKRKKLFLLASAGLGIWVGLQTFIQSQVVFLMVAGIFAVIGLVFKRKNVFAGFLILAGLASLIMMPEVYQFVSYLPDFISSRGAGSCLLSSAAPHEVMFKSLWIGLKQNQESPSVIGSLVGLPLFFLSMFNRRWLAETLCGIVILLLLCFGFPKFFCILPGLNGVAFGRHAFPYLQSIFYLSLFAGFLKFKTKGGMRILLGFLLLLGIVTFVRKGFVNEHILQSSDFEQHSFVPETRPKDNFITVLQDLSKTQNRRHFSPDRFLYPNWSGVFEILDLRILEAIYPKWTFELYSYMMPKWYEQSGPLPDRFVGTVDQKLDEGLQKLMVITRTSLISQEEGGSFLPSQGPYSEANCLKINAQYKMIIWNCSQIGPVDYFPKNVRTVPESQILSEMKSASFETLNSTVFLIGDSKDNEKKLPGQGRILKFERSVDKISFDLQVDAAGIFVITDSYFPGWIATVDGKATRILRANYAFKAVEVPVGNHHLQLKFEPGHP